MKILCIGGKGLIGSAIVKHHLEKGDDVYTWDNESNKYNDYSNCLGKDMYTWDSEHECGCLEDAIDKHNFDIISHQAALVGVGDSQLNPERYIDNNISITTELLQAMINLNKFPKRLILAGSMGPYGEGSRICPYCYCYPVNTKRISIDILCPNCGSKTIACETYERSERVPQSFYALSKMMQEEMFRIFATTYNVPTTVLRYFSVYGTEVNPNNPYTGVLSVIMNKMLNSDCIELNEDGEQQRDLIHCDDIAELHYLVSNLTETEYMYNMYNVGTGTSYSMKEIALRMMDAFGYDGTLKFNGKLRSGDIKDSIADTSKTELCLNWKAKINLEDSIVKYCKYVDENRDKFITEDTCAKADEELKAKGLL